MPDLERLRWIAEAEFLALVRSTTMVRDKLRVVLNDGSCIDFCGPRKFSAVTLTTGRDGMWMGRFTVMTTCHTPNGRASSRFPTTFMLETKIPFSKVR